MRKAILFGTSCIALVASLGLSASGAFANDPGCEGNNLPLGIYNSSLQLGQFDLSFSPTTAGADAQITGGAVLCGTETNSPSRFYQVGRITFPNKGETLRCARPGTLPAACAGQTSLPDQSYAGSAITDSWCNAGLISLCVGGLQFNDLQTTTLVDYNTSGPGSGPNRCNASSTTIVACFESIATPIPGISCGSDVIVNKSGSSAYTLTLYQPTCNSGLSPVYFDGIDSLILCKYANTPGSSACGSNTANWMQRNGTAGQYTFTLGARLTNGQVVSGAKTGSWT